MNEVRPITTTGTGVPAGSDAPAPGVLSQLRPAVVLVVLFTILTGLAFPLGFVAAARVTAPFNSEGSLVERDGHVIGSAIIGQEFKDARYFHARPSATTDTDPNDSTKQVPAPYNADSSGASNLGATSKALIDRVTADVANAGPAPVPADAVTTSASGLDPDISPENAARQVAAVAAARKMPADKVQQLVDANTHGRLIGIIGEPRVNVLALNLALDAAAR